MQTFKEQCVELRKRDFTLTEIVRMTGRPKTSVYVHIKHIPLSIQKQREIELETTKRARSVAASRKGKAARPFRTFTDWTSEFVLLTAHLLFDGEISKSCVYNNRSTELVKRVRTLMRLIYDYEPAEYINPKTGVRRISYHNVALALFFKIKTIELIHRVHMLPLGHQRAFVRAFFDDEGCMDYRPRRSLRRIRGYQDDSVVLETVKKCLLNLGIDADLRGRNEIVITGRENLTKFQKQIDFSKGVRVNGSRSNSIWKKSLEKRMLLDMAIRSFKV